MKHTKRLLTWILAVVLVVVALALVACDDKPEAGQLNVPMPELGDNQMALIIKNRDNTFAVHTVTLGNGGTDATTVEGVISYLVGQNLLTVDWFDSGETGKWLNDIGGLAPDAAAHEYVAVYTSVEKDWSASASSTSYKIGNVTVDYSQYGVSGMSVEAGAIIYFELQTW